MASSPQNTPRLPHVDRLLPDLLHLEIRSLLQVAVIVCLRLAIRTFILTSSLFIPSEPEFYGLLTLELCVLDTEPHAIILILLLRRLFFATGRR